MPNVFVTCSAWELVPAPAVQVPYTFVVWLRFSHFYCIVVGYSTPSSGRVFIGLVTEKSLVYTIYFLEHYALS